MLKTTVQLYKKKLYSTPTCGIFPDFLRHLRQSHPKVDQGSTLDTKGHGYHHFLSLLLAQVTVSSKSDIGHDLR